MENLEKSIWADYTEIEWQWFLWTFRTWRKHGKDRDKCLSLAIDMVNVYRKYGNLVVEVPNGTRVCE